MAWRRSGIAIAACALFLILGILFIPLLGLENDESLFGSALYSPQVLYSVDVLGARVPLMLMTYVGALKGILYGPVFRVWAPNLYSIRVPMVLAGAVTVWLFFLLLRRLGGDGVALAGTALLATDSLFFLTTIFDWGPVALQHLFLVGGMLLCVRFADTGGLLDLAGGFFLFGLGMWDKALFVWMLSGLAVATLAIVPKELARLWSWRRAGLAAAAFAAGAFPLLLFNGTHRLETYRANSSFALAGILPKFLFLIDSTRVGIYDWLIQSSGSSPVSGLVYAFLLAALLWPILWKLGDRGRARTMLFAVIAMTIAWLEMAVNGFAGASVHHTVLLWPMPQLFIAMALGAAWPASARRVASAAVIVIVAWNLGVLAKHYSQMTRNGGAMPWNDAILGLSSFLETEHSEVCADDWGLIESLTLLNRGRLTLVPVWDGMPERRLTELEEHALRERMESPRSLFVTHTEGNEFFPGNRARLLALAKEFGETPELVRTISDSHGHPRFEVMRFRLLK